MNFSRLPDNVFLEILEYLPLEKCIRVGRVDKLFRRMAKWATSCTKSLNLYEYRFRKLTADQLALILNLCSSNLERIKFGAGFREVEHWRQLTTTLAQYECPRLTDIDLENNYIDYDVFEQLIRNCPKMKSLEWSYEFVGFPAITNNNLKKLRLKIYDNASLRTLIGRCPNLEELDLIEVNMEEESMSLLDEFFASIPHVRRISINLFNMDAVEFEDAELVNFYNLPLTKLSIDFDFDDSAGDVLLHKVVKSFPRLRELSLVLRPTNQGIASLANLQELQVIYLKLRGVGSSNYDEGIRQLAHCHKLRILNVYHSMISGGNLVNLLRSCSQLERVVVWNITEVESPEEAVVILESLAGMPQRNITIKFHWPTETFESIWEGEPVKAAIKKLEEEDGLKINIEIGSS